jgi:hypothetical protein
MRHKLSILFIMGVLSGCQHGSPGAIAMDNPQQLQQEKTADLCSAYGVTRGQAVFDELQRRKAIATELIPVVRAKRVAVGMSSCEVLASWGPPDAINRTITARGTFVQWVYEDLDGMPQQYVYLDNGIVSSLQD